MKTHDIARALTALARTLKDAENAELATVAMLPKNSVQAIAPASGDANVPAALVVLLRLSEYRKDEWRALIKQMELDVPVKNTDSVRDIIGRLLKHLSESKAIQEKLIEKAQEPQPGTSPELMKALSILLNK